MAGLVDLARLGGILPKTITQSRGIGNPPPRTVETTGGMLNSIGLDNDGIEAFIAASSALSGRAGHGRSSSASPARAMQEFVAMAARLDGLPGVARLGTEISCPNVSGGVDFGTDPRMCQQVVAGVPGACSLADPGQAHAQRDRYRLIARAAEAGGADAISLINTCLGMAIDWRTRRPILGNVMGGLSGPAIKPIALRAVYQVARAVSVPLVGIGGIATMDDVMEFLVAGATAVEIGTANFYNPTVSMQILDALAGRPGGTRCRVGGRSRRHAWTEWQAIRREV